MLAIIIPYYKLTFFKGTLQSLANQTDKRFKVYIGDDASPEDCISLLQQFEGSFDFVCHRFDVNLGSISLTQQWERCISLSVDEEWIMILGDDDVLGDNVVEEFYKQYIFYKNIVNVVRYATIVLDERDKTKSEVFEHPKLESGLSFFVRKLKWETRSSLSEYVFRREVFLKHRFKNYPSAFYSDDRAWIDFTENRPIYTINESVIYIRISNYSLSGKANIETLKIAELQYLNYFFFKKMHLLSKKDRLFLLKKIEYSFCFNNVMNFSQWLRLYYNFWRNYDIREIVRLHKRIIERVIRRLVLVTNKLL